MSHEHPGVVWKAEPHTLAKIALLDAYLKAWLSILGLTRPGQQLLYIDGFAGPGEYSGGETGSPIQATRAAKSVLNTYYKEWKAGDVHCAFIESDPARAEHLKGLLARERQHLRVHTHTYAMKFVDGIQQVRKDIPKPFLQNDPLFAFIDPFGATGVPFSVIQEIMANPCSEILLNLDADGIDRIFATGSAANEANLDQIFGCDCWRAALVGHLPQGQRYRRILQLYDCRLRTIPGVKYVYAFEMRGRADTLNYYLVFASSNKRGLEKMKEAMSTVDQTGEYGFSDANVDQPCIFKPEREDQVQDYARQLYNAYKGRLVTFDHLVDYTLNYTPFLNPGMMLQYLHHKGGLARVVPVPGKEDRRKTTFNEKAVKLIQFATGSLATDLFGM